MAAVARALRCEVDERDHLFHLAGLTPPDRAGRHVPPGLLRLVDRLTDVPVLVLTGAVVHRPGPARAVPDRGRPGLRDL